MSENVKISDSDFTPSIKSDKRRMGYSYIVLFLISLSLISYLSQQVVECSVFESYLNLDLGYLQSFDQLFDHLIIISLMSGERKHKVHKLIELFGTTNYSIIGVNGTEVTNNRLDPLWKVIDPNFLETFSPGELGCALAHRKAYEFVVAQKFSHVLIIEDDIIVHLENFLRAVPKYRPYIKESWEIVHW